MHTPIFAVQLISAFDLPTAIGLATLASSLATLCFGLLKFWPEYKNIRRQYENLTLQIRGNIRATFLTSMVSQEHFRNTLNVLMKTIIDIQRSSKDDHENWQRYWRSLKRQFSEDELLFLLLLEPKLRRKVQQAIEAEDRVGIERLISKLLGG